MTTQTAAVDIPVCDKCGTEFEPDYSMDWDEDSVFNDAGNGGWFFRHKITRILPPDETHPHQRRILESVETFCEGCAPKCPDCGDTLAANLRDGSLSCENVHDEDDED